MTLDVGSEIGVERILDERRATAQFVFVANRQLVEVDLRKGMERVRSRRMKQKFLRHVVEATALDSRALRKVHSQQKDFVFHTLIIPNTREIGKRNNLNLIKDLRVQLQCL